LLPTLSNAFTSLFKFETSISIDAIEGNGVDLRDIAVSFDSLSNKFSSGKSSYLIQIGLAILPEYNGRIKDIILQCHDGVISKQEIACSDGEISFNDPLASAKQAKVQFYRNKQGDISFKMGSFNLADGSATLSARLFDGSWVAKLKSNKISFAKLRQRLPSFPELFSTGLISGDMVFTGAGASMREIQGNTLIKGLSFSNEESTVVGEEVASKFSFTIKRKDNVWESEINATTFEGELYFDPIFIDANEGPKDLYGVINWEIGTNQIEFAPLHYEDPNVVHIELRTVIDYEKKSAVTPVQANIQYAFFPNVYDEYMQSFLLDTNIADLATKGSLTGSLLIDGSRIIAMDLQLGHLSFVDNQDRFSITKLNGGFGWGEQYSGKRYKFGFNTANIYKLRLEASEFSFKSNKEFLVLNQPVSVPLLDGAINIESFQVKQPGKKDQSILMDISLTPVSMSKLSTTLGWPEMNGNLAGYAPNVTYQQGDVDIQGALLIRGFGGTTTIHNLSAADLFSITPKLSADIKLNNLDLSSLTETFSFGEITGRLNGSIDNLQFVSWSPVQFDAWFGTPEKDKSRHRISQTAVDNLTQVGNGGANILSKSFLKFFDSFGYNKLGLGCTLKNNICKMRGVDDAGKGFYIVKGSGVPRIDIVGYTNEVSWPVLTARLKRVVGGKDVIVN
jgi:hypothetical protein